MQLNVRHLIRKRLRILQIQLLMITKKRIKLLRIIDSSDCRYTRQQPAIYFLLIHLKGVPPSQVFSFSLTITLGLFITTVQLSGTSSTTIAFAPILTLLPTWTFPIIFAPAPIKQLLPMVGAPPRILKVIRANRNLLVNHTTLADFRSL